MRSFLLSTVALAGLTVGAAAADLPSRRAPVPYVAVPVFTWTGFYIGANVGGGVGRFDNRYFDAPAGGGVAAGTRPARIRDNTTGFIGGGQIGYNYQIGGFVLGVEADADYTDFRRTRTVTTATLAGPQANTVRNELNYLGTVRGRVGYSFDRLLVYGTGGFAFGDVFSRTTFFTPAGAVASASARSTTETGWVAGGGVEYAIPTDSFLNFLNFFSTSAVTIKAEYLHYDLGSQRASLLTAAGATAYTTRVRTDGDIGRIGVNYKF